MGMTKNEIAARLTAALAARGLSVEDVRFDDAASYAADVEEYEGGTLTEADWDTVINSWSTSGRVVC